MPGPDQDDIEMHEVHPIREDEEYEELDRGNTVEQWRYFWASDWPEGNETLFSRIWRPAMEWVEEQYGHMLDGTPEEEDEITYRYRLDAKRILAGVYCHLREFDDERPAEKTLLPRFLTDDQILKYTDAHLHAEIAFGDDVTHYGAEGSLQMGLGEKSTFNNDVYEIRTRGFLWQRLRQEQRDVATSCIFLLFLSVLELALGATILGLATRELDGGKTMVVISGITSGAVMIIGSVIGAVGGLSANETFIRWFMTSGYWTMAILSTLLYVEMAHIKENEDACSPSLRDHMKTSRAGSASCGDEWAEIGILLCFAFFGVFITFLCTYLCSILLDALNDMTKIADTLLLFRYFQYCHHVLRERTMKAFTRKQFGDDGLLGTYNNISPVYSIARGLYFADTKLHGIDVTERGPFPCGM